MSDLDSHLERYYHASVMRSGDPTEAIQKLTEALATDSAMMDMAMARKRDLEDLERSMPTPAQLAERDFVGFCHLKMLRAVLG